MYRRKFFSLICLSALAAPLVWGVDQGRAQTPAVAQPQAAVQPTVKGAQKSAYQKKQEAYQKRQEAKKRLQAANEARKAQRGAEFAVPASDGKGGAQ